MITSVFIIMMVTNHSTRGEIDSAWIYENEAINYLQHDLKCHQSEKDENVWINNYQHYRLVEVSLYRWDE